LAAGGFGLAIAAVIVWLAELSSDEIIAVLTLLPAFFLLAGCLLATIDIVRTRIKSGEEVGWLLRVFFGRMLSVWLWFVVLLIVGFPLAVFIGSLTWKR
jgi:hypothetical protein